MAFLPLNCNVLLPEWCDLAATAAAASAWDLKIAMTELLLLVIVVVLPWRNLISCVVTDRDPVHVHLASVHFRGVSLAGGVPRAPQRSPGWEFNQRRLRSKSA